MTRGLAAVACTTLLAVGATACGGGDPDPGSAPDPSTPARPQRGVELLSQDTPPVTARLLGVRDLCVNASDYTYLVSALAQQAPTDGDFDDPDFARTITERTLVTVEALTAQLPPDQQELGDGAVATFRTFRDLAEPLGYEFDDPDEFNRDFNQRTARYQRGNSQLVAELATECDPQLPEYAEGLTPLR